MTRFLPIGMLALVAACSSDKSTGTACPDAQLAYTIHVTAVDANTNAQITSEARLIVANASIADTAVSPNLQVLVPAGVYDLTVTHPAYSTWHQANFQLLSNSCGVIPRSIVANLVIP